MDVYLKYPNGQESVLTDCTVTVKQDYEDICSYEWGNQTVPIGKQYMTVEVPMGTNFDWSTFTTTPYSDSWADSSHWYPSNSVHLGVDVAPYKEEIERLKKALEQTKERRDKMISRKIFNEALAEAGVDKGTRRKVEKLNEEDFQYLLATLLAKAFDPGMLAVFEPDVQKVKVVEDA